MTCKGITLRGEPCHRKVTATNYCFQHLSIEFRQEKPPDCPVCCESLAKQRSALECGHWIHTRCVIESAKEECPICRHPLNLSPRAKKQIFELAKRRNLENIMEEEKELLQNESMSFQILDRINNIIIANNGTAPIMELIEELIEDEDYQNFIYELIRSSNMDSDFEGHFEMELN